MGWSHFFRRYARRGEPIKVEGDKRDAGRHLSDRPELRHPGVVAAGPSPGDAGYDLRQRSVIAGLQHHRLARASSGPTVSAENMSRALPMYRRGLAGRLSDRRQKHEPARASSSMSGVRRRPAPPAASRCRSRGVEALQDFAARRRRAGDPAARGARRLRLPAGCRAATDGRAQFSVRLAVRAVERERRDLDVEAFAGSAVTMP